MKSCLLSISFFLILLTSFGQGIPEINHWFFGGSTGIDFSSGNPVPIQFTSPLYSYEGTCSISDSLGNLLFYTDGTSVWNKVHNPMVNGTGLMGNASSTQSAIIVQRPCYKDRFYIFTTPAQGSDKLYYSEVDLSLNNGLGAVTSTKNISLGANVVSEKLAVIWHTDEQSLWLICQEPAWSSANRYFAYSISANGVNPVPVESIAGMNDGHGISYLKASPDGTTLASCNQQGVNVLDFDRTTGMIALRYSIPQETFPWYQFLYGAEFSPDGNLLYISTNYTISQFDLTEPTVSDIIGSAVIINDPITFPLGSLQLAPDGKIYCAKYESFSLACIESPNSTGLACNFNENALQLNGMCFYGLPTFQMSYHYYFDSCPDIPPVIIPETFLEIPNIITPNGDGTNDSFILKNTSPGQVSITIANRWGNTVFFSDTYLNDWSGENLPDGTYFYTIWDTDSEQTFTGFVQVIR